MEHAEEPAKHFEAALRGKPLELPRESEAVFQERLGDAEFLESFLTVRTT